MLTVKVDPSAALKGLSHVQRKQVPFAMAVALNRVAIKAQTAERAAIGSNFKLKRPDWNLKAVYISKQDRATKTSWVVVIQIQEGRSYLNKFEEGGSKFAINGRKMLAIPDNKAFPKGIVPKDSPLRPSALNMRKFGEAYRGDMRTFIAPMKGDKESGIFQRLGRDKRGRKKRNAGVRGREGADSGVRLLYTLVSRVPIKAQLRFAETVQRTVQAEWEATASQALADALKPKA